MTRKTPEQIAEEAARTVLRDNGLKNPAREDPLAVLGFEMGEGIEYEEALKQFALAVIEADREQRHHWDGEIYIVQGENGDVLDVFRDADEASAAYQYTTSGAPYSIIAETVWEPGEYAEQRIRTLTADWEEVVNYGRDEGEEPHRAADYALSGDDWRAGLCADDADEIARLIEWAEGQQ